MHGKLTQLLTYTTMLTNLITRDIFRLIRVWFLLPLTLLLALIVLIAIIINEFCRFIVSSYLRLCGKHDLILVKNGRDSSWECSTISKMVVVPLILIQNPTLQLENIISNLNSALLGKQSGIDYIKLKSKFTSVAGYVAWKLESNFRAENHVRSLDKSKAYTDSSLLDIISELMEDMDHTKPQWEIVLIPRLRDINSSVEKAAVIFRFHHGYADGMSILTLMKRLSPDFEYRLNPLTFKISKWKNTVYIIRAILFGSLTFYEQFIELLRSQWIPTENPPGKKYVYRSPNQISMSSLQKIKSETKATIANILALAFVESYRRILPRKRLLERIRISEIMTFLPYPDTALHNRFSTFVYPLDTINKSNLNLLNRLTIVKDVAQNELLSPQAILCFISIGLIGRFPKIFFPAFVPPTLSAFFLSNVPVAKNKFSLFGCKCESMEAFIPCFDGSSIFTCMGYSDSVSVCGVADSGFVSAKELHEILHLVPMIVHEMEDKLVSFKSNGIRSSEHSRIPVSNVSSKKSDDKRYINNDK